MGEIGTMAISATIDSIAFPVAPLQIPCLFGLAPVFMRVLCSARNSLIISLINSLFARCYSPDQRMNSDSEEMEEQSRVDRYHSCRHSGAERVIHHFLRFAHDRL